VGPVCVRLKVKPQRKFVESKRSTHAIADGHETAEEDGERRVRSAEFQQISVADKQQDKNAPNQVMNVVAAHGDPIERADPCPNRHHQQPHPAEGNRKGDRSKEHALPRPIGDGGAYEIPQPRQLQEHQQQNHDKGCKGKQ